MRRPLLFAILLAVLLGACKKPGVAPEQLDGGSNHEEAHLPPEHDNEVTLSPEALANAGIETRPAQKRALTGGTAIPAEVIAEPTGTAHVAPLVSGRVARVSVAFGQRVRRGELLGVVASTDVSAARARLGQGQARLSAAEATLKRQQQLTTEGIGAQRSLIDAAAQASEMRAEVEGLRQQLSVFGSGKAGDLALTAPIDGVVVDMHATVGETAAPDQVAFIIIDPSQVWVRGNVPELELGLVQTGAAVFVRLHAFPELAMAGVITYVAPALDERTRSLPIRVALDAPDARLRSGLFGSIELLGGKRGERVLVIPAEAVTTLDGQTIAFVATAKKNTFRAQPIALGRRASGYFEVRAGLAEGDALAVSGAFTLKSVLRGSELSEGHEQ